MPPGDSLQQSRETLGAAPPTVEELKEPVREELEAVHDRISEFVTSDFRAMEEVNEYLLGMRGKFLRPTLLLLANRVGGRPSSDAVRLGALVEMVHLATLVHDDAVDHSVRRRGMPTINARWSHQVAVIAGDYLYSRAVTEITRLESLEAISVLAGAANRMAVGELRQLTSRDALHFSERDYYRLCECKTASLLSAACEIGALFGVEEHRESLREYGFQLGMAFQITDDLLDYASSSRITGKPTGLDLREHKVTLPLIAALPEFEPAERVEVRKLFGEPEPSDARIASVMSAVGRRGGIDYARERADRYLERAGKELVDLPPGEALRSLRLALEYVAERRS